MALRAGVACSVWEVRFVPLREMRYTKQQRTVFDEQHAKQLLREGHE